MLVLFPVTKREYLDMREAWMAAHGLLDGKDGKASSGKEGEGACGCCCREKGRARGDEDGKEEKEKKCCPCGCSAASASKSLPPICFADYVMKSFDDDVAGIVGLVRIVLVPSLFRRRRRKSRPQPRPQ